MRFDGLPAEDYKVTLDLSPASLSRQLAAAHEPASLRQTELQSLSILRHATLHVWVSRSRPIGMAEIVSADLPGAPAVSMTIDIDLTYRDKPMAIAAPTAGVASWRQLQAASASQAAATASS
jgi:hypothetical protein